jgi:creatinine amidohydrolase
MVLATHPELVHLDRLVEGEGKALDRLRALREAGVQTGIWWYADYPTHYSGDASHADAAAGERLLDAQARAVARAVSAIKADAESSRLLAEFYAASRAPSS